MKHSAGIFLYNSITAMFLIVHPSGNYNRHAPWHIPKGEISPGSDPDNVDQLRAEAIRELEEETGIRLTNTMKMDYLGSQKLKSGGKIVHAFFCRIEGKENPAVQLDRENDRFLWVRIDDLNSYLHEAQRHFIDRLRDRVG